MTSKLIERLINKEYLTDRERKEWLNAIKERLEALEKENVELQLQLEQLEDSAKIRMQQADKYATTLKEKYLDLKQENKENAEFYVKSRDALWNLKQENEKLKKKLNIYEKYTGIYYDKETKEYYIAVDCEFGCKGDVITKNEFEVLKND